MKKKIFISASVLLMTMFISACDHFLDVNTDPTRLKTANINQVLVAAEGGLGFYSGTDVYLYSSLFAQQATGSGVAGSQTRFYDSYIVTNNDVNNIYTNYFAGVLADLDYVKKLGLSTGNPTYTGIAKIMQAFTYQQLVDAWGDVPYKEALKGVANVQPKYDNSKEIYDSLFVLIDAGIAQTKLANVRAVSSDDLIYGGDMSKWEKFGNTLKLRLALHYAKEDGGAKLNAILASGGPFMSSPADNFQMTFESTTARQNPIQQFETSRTDYYAPSQFFVNLMNGKSDPRRAVYFTTYPATTAVTNTSVPPYVGTPSNATQTNPNSRIHTYLRGAVVSDTYPAVSSRVGTTTNTGVNGQGAPTAIAVTYDGTAPLRMLLYSEYCFIRAEATLTLGAPAANAQAQTAGGSTFSANTFTTAQDWYQQGIRASMADCNAVVTGAIPAASITAYLTANGTLTNLNQIMEEKSVANFGVNLEPWTDFRRTGFPALTSTVAANANGNTVIPRILVYALGEQQSNAANLPTRASLTVKGVFWDK